MMHDPEIYTDPMQFNPERINEDDTEMAKVLDIAFGFGRRSCPGQSFAENTLFAVVSTVLASCHVLPVVNVLGARSIPEYAYTTGIVMCVMMSTYKRALLTTVWYSLTWAVFPKIFLLICNHDPHRHLRCSLKL